ncbi:hypothetical protein HaLaN_03075 [Haematococcus lacustris]|uniref:Uncharacterized protein n=1 Tax=Haematococcus lacustris TaxID=44745 RepID=A0A699YDI6_HAELA|nr:hypothetical protein HaLaN_03075 [Haematococcus lacustris]
MVIAVLEAGCAGWKRLQVSLQAFAGCEAELYLQAPKPKGLLARVQQQQPLAMIKGSREYLGLVVDVFSGFGTYDTLLVQLALTAQDIQASRSR